MNGHEIPIPLLCPKCSGNMVVVRYDVILKLLKERSWQVCKNCKYERSVNDFKKELIVA